MMEREEYEKRIRWITRDMRTRMGEIVVLANDIYNLLDELDELRTGDK